MGNRHMTAADLARILAIIRDWPYPKLTWELLQSEIADRLGRAWTYPTLTKRPELVAEYEERKRTLKGGGAAGRKAHLGSDDAEEAQRSALKAENAELKRIIAEYDERFVRFIYNACVVAHPRGKITPEILDRPIPKIERR